MAQFTIGKKLTLGVAAALASLAVLSFTALKVTSALGTLLDSAVNSTARKLDLLGKTRHAFQQLKDESLRVQMAYAIGDMERFSAASAKGRCGGCHQPDSVDESKRKIEALGTIVHETNAKLRQLVSDQVTLKALDSFDQGAAAWAEHTKSYLQLASGNQFDAAHSILTEKMFPILVEVEKSAEMLADKEEEALRSMNADAQSRISGGRALMLVVIAVNLLACGGVLWLVFRISATLRVLVHEMNEGAVQVASAAAEISTSSQHLAQNASDQSASMERSSSASEEIHSMANRNRESAREAATLVSGAQQRFEEANAALGDLQSAMGRIELSSGKISQIIKVIDEIAFQTNILALNAAVEAARAGEAGLGFAVVADEVRNLAQRCAQAAKDTASLIEESIGNSHQGKQKAERVAAVIRVITEQSATIRKLVDEVTKGSEEQSLGVDQVAKSLAQMDQVTQKTAASAEQCAAAGEELTAQSETLKGLTARLHAMVETQPSHS